MKMNRKIVEQSSNFNKILNNYRARSTQLKNSGKFKQRN